MERWFLALKCPGIAPSPWAQHAARCPCMEGDCGQMPCPSVSASSTPLLPATLTPCRSLVADLNICSSGGVCGEPPGHLCSTFIPSWGGLICWKSPFFMKSVRPVVQEITSENRILQQAVSFGLFWCHHCDTSLWQTEPCPQGQFLTTALDLEWSLSQAGVLSLLLLQIPL